MSCKFKSIIFILLCVKKRLTQNTRAKPSRKTKSKGNHLKNLQNRIEIKTEYEQTSTSNTNANNSNPNIHTASTMSASHANEQKKQQNLIANELAAKKFDKSSV